MATYDIGLFKGHGKYSGGFDPGAVSTYGGHREYDIVSKIVDKALVHLKNSGISVLTGENYYNNDLLSGHTIKSKCIYSVHINAGGGRRTEFLVPFGEKFFKTENAIGSEMVKLGIPAYQIKSRDYNSERFVNRTDGISSSGKDYYKEIRTAWGKGVSLTIFEVGFIDSEDINIIVKNIDKIALILAKELAKLCNKDIVVPKETKPVTKPSGGFYRVVVGSFKDKSNAEVQVKKLKEKGFDSFIAYYDK